MRSLLLRVFLVKKRVGGWVGGSAPWPPCCPHPGTPSLSPPGRGRERGRGRGVGCCGEFRASPCSLCSRPPSRGEGGVLVYA